MIKEENGDRVLFGKNLVFLFDMYDLDYFDELLINGEFQKIISLDYKKFMNEYFSEYFILGFKFVEKINDFFLWCEVEKYLNVILNEMVEVIRIEDFCCILYDMFVFVKSGDEFQNEVQLKLLQFYVNVNYFNEKFFMGGQ